MRNDSLLCPTNRAAARAGNDALTISSWPETNELTELKQGETEAENKPQQRDPAGQTMDARTAVSPLSPQLKQGEINHSEDQQRDRRRRLGESHKRQGKCKNHHQKRGKDRRVRRRPGPRVDLTKGGRQSALAC